MRPRHAVPIALLAGLALVLAFPSPGVRPLAVVGAGLLVAATREQRTRTGLALGLLTGASFLVLHLMWLRVVGVHAWLVLTALETLFFGLLGAALALVSRMRLWPIWSAAVWVGVEALRARVPWGGFTWGRLAASQDSGPFTPWVAVAGMPALSLVVALTGALLAAGLLALLDARRLFSRGRNAVAAVSLVGAAAVVVSGLLLPGPPRAAGATRVAVVQGNVPRLGLDAFEQTRRVLRNHVGLTVELGDQVRTGTLPAPDLVIWPENTTDIDPRTDAESAFLIDGAARAVDRPILVGAVLDRTDGRVENAGVVWDPVSGPGERYVKRHLVPYGEYVPLRSLLEPRIGRLALIPRDFVPGSRPGVLRVGGVVLGDVICFEVAYDDLVRDVVRGGARLLVVQTNNATYGRTAQPAQQFAMSRLRAVETGRAVVVAATSGISGVVLPSGRVVARTAEFTPATLLEQVPLVDGRTLATRVGAWPELAISLVGVLGVLLAVRRRRRGGTT